ncbi:MAG: DUF6326 family protein [Sediminibacterium sp.]
MTTSSTFEDSKVNVKIKLSALWTSVTLCYLYCDYFELYVPKKVEGIINGENLLDSPQKLFAASFLLAIPAVMVFLSIILKPIVNRLVNIIIGILFTVMMVLIALTYSEPWYTFYLFFAILESLITAVIVWYAWKWPKQEVEPQIIK